MDVRVSDSASAKPSTARFESLDVFRGATIVAMILVNSPGDRAVAWAPLLHSPWHGWTFADTIFPAFLWIAGFALTLSMRARAGRGDSRARLFAHAVRRALILIACGLFLEGFPYFELEHYQVTGVLQKIALSYLLTYGICLVSGWHGRILALVAVYFTYIVFMLGGVLPGCDGGPWSMDCNASRRLNDLLLAGHMWPTPSHNDPDGVATTFAATASVLLGVLCAQAVARKGAALLTVRRLAITGAGLILAGYALGLWIPVNKILWTPSYSLLMAGFSSAVFAALFYVVEVCSQARWLRPFAIFGMNALAAYMLSRIVVDVLKMHVHRWSLYHEVLLPLASAPLASFLFALANVLAVYLIAWIMYRMRIFVKL